MLDTIRPYETPEGVDLELHIAGPIVRAAATAIDMLIRSAFYIVISIVFTFLGELGVGLMLVSFFLIEWFYPVIFEVTRGATPGKRSMGLIVIHDNGTPISFSSSMIRNLLRTVDFLPFLYGFGLVSMLVNKDFKRLGDMAAGTLVIYHEKNKQHLSIPDAISKPLPKPLTIQEQRSILDFAERSQLLSESRQQELAALVKDFTGSQSGDSAKLLFQYATWLHKGQ